MKTIIYSLFIAFIAFINSYAATQATIVWVKDVATPTGKSCNYTHTYSLKNTSTVNATNYTFYPKSAQKLINGSWATTSFNNSTEFLNSSQTFSINAGVTKNISISFCVSPAAGIGTYKLFFGIKDNTDAILTTLSGGGLNTTFTYYPAPEAPTATVLSCSEIKISWIAITGAKSYDVYRNGSLLKNTTSTSYTDNTVVKTAYYFQIKAKDENGETNLSASTNVTITAPAKPTGLTTTAISSSQIDLSWNKVENASVYAIYRDNVYIKGVTTNNYSDKNVDATTSHCYKIQAIDQCAYPSVFSDIVCSNALKQNFTVSATSSPAVAGNIDGAGVYSQGSTCELNAIPNDGYVFDHWSENDAVVSTKSSYSFTVKNERNLVANFSKIVMGKTCPDFDIDLGGTLRVWITNSSSIEANGWKIFRCAVLPGQTYFFNTNSNGGSSVFDADLELYDKDCNVLINSESQSEITWLCNYASESYVFLKLKGKTASEFGDFVLAYKRIDPNCIISVSSFPATSGTTSGDGVYSSSDSCTVIASANAGFRFINWKDEENQIVSTSENYTFLVTSSTNLVANFDYASTVTQSIFENTFYDIYPNPSHNIIYLKNNGIDGDKVHVFSITGNLIGEFNLKTDYSIDISNLSKGIYLLKLLAGSNYRTLRFIKN